MLKTTPDPDFFHPSQPLLTDSCKGFCTHCRKTHNLAEGNSRVACVELMKIMKDAERIDYTVSNKKTDPKCATSYLFGKARGKMFGVLECLGPDGSPVLLKAFSGQYNGLWEVEDWVPPIFKVATWQKTQFIIEKEIKRMGKIIDSLPINSQERGASLFKRKKLSQDLMIKLHSLYIIRSFRGQSSPLAQVFPGQGGIPTGTGDCCAPKLLNYAICHNLTPISISEFYWGRKNKSGTRHHGHFYPSCNDKCHPILGYMLCGLQ